MQVEPEAAPQQSRAWIVVRAVISVAGIAFVSWHYSRQAAEGRWFLAGMIACGLLTYAAIGYVLRPKYARGWLRSQRRREVRSQLMFVQMLLWPGRFVAVSLLDFVAMLFGRQLNHDRFQLDLTA